MQSSFCKYENKEECMLLKGKCDPGRKGCVIKRGFVMTQKEDDKSLGAKKKRVFKDI